jgi:hypothetical protein
MSEMFGFELWSTSSNYCLLLYFLFVSQLNFFFKLFVKVHGTFYHNATIKLTHPQTPHKIQM